MGLWLCQLARRERRPASSSLAGPPGPERKVDPGRRRSSVRFGGRGRRASTSRKKAAGDRRPRTRDPLARCSRQGRRPWAPNDRGVYVERGDRGGPFAYGEAHPGAAALAAADGLWGEDADQGDRVHWLPPFGPRPGGGSGIGGISLDMGRAVSRSGRRGPAVGGAARAGPTCHPGGIGARRRKSRGGRRRTSPGREGAGGSDGLDVEAVAAGPGALAGLWARGPVGPDRRLPGRAPCRSAGRSTRRPGPARRSGGR